MTDYNWEEQCEEREVVRQDCRTEYETRNRTVTTQKCNQYFEEVCANYTVPQYEVVSTHTLDPADSMVVDFISSLETGGQGGERLLRVPQVPLPGGDGAVLPDLPQRGLQLHHEQGLVPGLHPQQGRVQGAEDSPVLPEHPRVRQHIFCQCNFSSKNSCNIWNLVTVLVCARGECEDVPDQKCRVVPRQVCQQVSWDWRRLVT